ncbi:MAG: hypothetical protein QXU92_00795 [Candidatus Diapherotrites archaeon]
MSPDTFVLSSLKYVESSKGVFVYFSSSSINDFVKFFSFRPKILLPLSIPFDFLVSFFGSENVMKNPYSYSVFFDDLASLKSAVRVLSLSFGININIIEPERQFLILNGWSYHDAFVLNGDSFEKVSSSAFFSVESILSNICRVPSNVCANFFVVKKIFVENLFFGSDLFFDGSFFVSKIDFGFNSNFVEIDYSAFLVFLASLQNFSLGSFNCSCCKPNSLEADNLLKSSLVKARFLSDGFSFFSVSSIWAKKFLQKPSKNSLVGPFFRNKDYFLLVGDAFCLSKNGFVEIVSSSSVFWSCRSKVSFFSFEAKRLLDLLSCFSSSIHVSSSKSNVVECLQAESNVFEYSSIVSNFLSLMSNFVFSVGNVCSVEAIHFECLSYEIACELASVFPNRVFRFFPLSAKFVVKSSDNLSFVLSRLSCSYKIPRGLLKVDFRR